MKIKLIILLLIFINSLNAITITGIGYGKNENESLKEALADLSNKISVTVKSNFKTIIETDNDEFKKFHKKTIFLYSNLPIKGVNYQTINGIKVTKITAILDSDNSLKSYIMELKRLEKNIDFNILKL